MQLMWIQAQGRTRIGFGPSGEAALRESLLAETEPLPVVGQTLDGMATARAEYKKRPAKRLARQCLTAERGQAIDAFAEIHRLDRHQDPHVRGDLDHER